MYTYPTRTALAAVKAKVRSATRKSTNQSLPVLLHRLNPVLRGWTSYHRHGASAKTFSYLSAFIGPAWRAARLARAPPVEVGGAADETKAILERLQAAQRDVDLVRGAFLSEMAELENRVGRIILSFFAPDEYPQFDEWVMGRVLLRSKLEILQKILKFLGLYDNTYKLDWKEMDDLRQQRNGLAHEPSSFVEASFMDPSGNYQVVHSGRLSGAPREDDPVRDMKELWALVERAAAASKKLTFEIGPKIKEAHAVPRSYFLRPRPAPGSRRLEAGGGP